MRKSNWIMIAAGASSVFIFIACKKETKTTYQSPVADSSHISITNASPAVADLRFYLNDKSVLLPNSPLSYGKTATVIYIANPTSYHPDTTLLPYFNIPAGYQQLGFGSDDNDKLSVLNQNFDPGDSYSVFIMDTIIHGRVASIVLKDNLANPDTAKGQLRFLNLSPDAPPLDLWIYPNAGYAGYKIFSGCGYLPGDFNSFVKAESFSVIDAGPYFLEATIAGTSNVLLWGFLMIPGKNVVTIYTRGYIGSTGDNAISVGVIQYKQIK